MEKSLKEKTLLERQLIEIAINWIRTVERRDFYHKLVEFCATVLKSQVCALFVRTTQIDGKPRVCLVAGKLPPNHSDGLRMNPEKVGKNPESHSYRISEKGEKDYDGITGRIASTGIPIKTGGYLNISNENGHAGKWDAYVWEGDTSRFKCMLGVPIKNKKNKIIGVIKVENKENSNSYSDDDIKLLKQISIAISNSLEELIRSGHELSPDISEFEYRVPRSKSRYFEKNKSGEVIIKHSMTAICHSDIYYYEHKKNRKKLDERLPLVIGHETTGEVYQVVGENRYYNGDIIKQKDKVVVIPLIPCWTCEICTNQFGENYCPSSRFMASNAPGSLRTIYKYYPNLILKINNVQDEKYYLFTEPMSNIVQMLNELGFNENGNSLELNMAPFNKQEFTYFHVEGDSFTNIFDSITYEEPNPRTLLILTNPNAKSELSHCQIKHSNIMNKGLGLLGNPQQNTNNIILKKTISNPKILILGNGTMSYILTMLLSVVYNVPLDSIVVTGKTPSKLNSFKKMATPFIIAQFISKDGTYNSNELLVDSLLHTGTTGKYDIIFECVGSNSVEQNIDLAMKVLKDGGIIAMEGLTEDNIKLDFETLLKKNLFLKGFYRGSIKSYQQSLEFIEMHKSIRDFLETLIDTSTIINGKSGFHKVSNEKELKEIFDATLEKKEFGRIVINELE